MDCAVVDLGVTLLITAEFKLACRCFVQSCLHWSMNKNIISVAVEGAQS